MLSRDAKLPQRRRCDRGDNVSSIACHPGCPSKVSAVTLPQFSLYMPLLRR
jgi:hypothetical protein